MKSDKLLDNFQNGCMLVLCKMFMAAIFRNLLLMFNPLLSIFSYWVFTFHSKKFTYNKFCFVGFFPVKLKLFSTFSESNGQPHIDHIRQQKWHRLCCQIHWCRSCYRRSGWIRSRNRISLRISHRWLCQKSIPQTTTVFIRHFGICFVRSYGPFLSYDGLFAPIRLLEK